MRDAEVNSDTARWWAIDGGREWWRPGSPREAAASPDERSAAPDSAVAFWGVMTFTFVLLIAPQLTVPALQMLRLALVSAGVSIAALIAHRWCRHRPLWPMTRETWIAAALLAWAVVTVPWSYWPGGSVSLLLQVYVKSLVVFWLLVNTLNTPERIRRIAWALTMMSVPLAVVGVRHFLSGDFYGTEAARDFKRILGYGAPLTTNPNDLALILNLLLPIAVALLFIAKRPVIRLALVGAIALDVAGVFTTYSRGGFITLCAIFLTYLWKFRRRPARRYVWGLCICLVVLALIGLPLLPTSYVERLSTITDIKGDKTGSAEERWSDMLVAVQMVMNRPLVGAGIGQNILALNQERGSFWTEIHNVYLQYALDLGLPGVALFLALLALALWSTVRVQRESAGQPAFRDLFYLSEGVHVSLVAFAVAGMFHPIAYNIGFYYMAGLAIAIRETWRAYRSLPSPTPDAAPVMTVAG